MNEAQDILFEIYDNKIDLVTSAEQILTDIELINDNSTNKVIEFDSKIDVECNFDVFNNNFNNFCVFIDNTNEINTNNKDPVNKFDMKANIYPDKNSPNFNNNNNSTPKDSKNSDSKENILGLNLNLKNNLTNLITNTNNNADNSFDSSCLNRRGNNNLDSPSKLCNFIIMDTSSSASNIKPDLNLQCDNSFISCEDIFFKGSSKIYFLIF
jgi:hypothetical protein